MESWQQFLNELYAGRANAPGTNTRPRMQIPASETAIQRAESLLEQAFPEELRYFLLESNGVMEEISVDESPYFANIWLLWPVEQILKENQDHRSQDKIADGVVFFANAGADGILFGIETSSSEILAWSPIRQESWQLANNLRDFLKGWLRGDITV